MNKEAFLKLDLRQIRDIITPLPSQTKRPYMGRFLLPDFSLAHFLRLLYFGHKSGPDPPDGRAGMGLALTAIAYPSPAP